MCMFDLAIGRRTTLIRNDLAAGATLELPQNPYRLAIRMSVVADNTGRAGFGQSLSDVGTNKFLKMVDYGTTTPTEQFGMVELELNYRTDPGIIWGPLCTYNQVGTYFVVQTIMTEDLAAELKQFLDEQRRKYGGR